MPAINVARTDTFEVQRQKINAIGANLFSISAGGSDLSTGLLKLGDGSRSGPSLAFTSDDTLGIFKPTVGTLGFASGSKSILDLNSQTVISYQDLVLRQQVLDNAGLSILSTGANYDVGLYENLPITGGSGSGATANVVVNAFGGSVTTIGENYTQGAHNNINLSGGSGSGAQAFFTVSSFTGQIVDAGSGYVPGTYDEVPITGGSGTNAEASVTISGDILYSGTISSGTGNNDNNYSSVPVFNTPVQTFTVTTTSNGSPPPDNLYVIDGTTQASLSLEVGNTYLFDVSDSSVSGHPLSFSTTAGSPLNVEFYTVTSYGNAGSTGSFVELVIKDDAPTGSILYYCTSHSGMGGTANVSTGTLGQYGSGATANITVSGGVVTAFDLSGGADYKTTDEVYVPSLEIGQGSSGTFTITGLQYTGVVASLTITDQGQNYVIGDTISVNSSDVGGQGSGFSYQVNSTPGILDDISFISTGTGYQVGDVLTLPGQITNVTGTLRGFLETTASLTNGSAVITVPDTTGILQGMTITISDVVVPPGTTVVSVDSATQLTLSQAATQTSASEPVSFRSVGDLNIASVSTTTGIFNNYRVEKVSGTGELAPNTTVTGVNSGAGTVTLSADPVLAGDIVLNFIPSYGIPTTDVEFTIDAAGAVESVTIVEGGNGYVNGDLVSIDAADLKTPIDISFSPIAVSDISFSSPVPAGTFTVGQTVSAVGYTLEIREVVESGGNTDYIVTDYEQTLTSGETVTYNSVNYTNVTVSEEKGRFLLNNSLTPNLTLYVGNTYRFVEANPQADDTNPDLSFSTFPGGEWGSSLVDNITTTLSVTSSDINVADSTGIVSGMVVSVVSGDGVLFGDTEVQEVNGTTITLTKPPQNSGAAILSFTGKEFTDNVSKSIDEETEAVITTIKISDSTPSTLYYYSKNGADFGGSPSNEAILTSDPNNPATLGSGLSLSVVQVTSNDIISGDIVTGDFNVSKLISTELESTTATFTETLTSPDLTANTIKTDIIRFTDSSVTTPIQVFSNIDFLETARVGSTITLSSNSGNITTTGDISFSGKLVSNQYLNIEDNIISTEQSQNLVLSPDTNRLVKIDAPTALVIPAGNNNSRPTSSSGLAENGAIRFNTESQQYEGYSEQTDSWSSLGGVRDLDGNTTILAEESIGANDNTLWFINDSVNTVKFTPQWQEFVNVKKIRSVNTSAPTYSDWTSSTPVSLGSYLKYKENIYEVTVAGTTATSGNEPTHTSGATVNGTAELTFHISAVAPLTFDEISELRISPLGSTSLVVNGELKLSQNTISSVTDDIIIAPTGTNKVVIDTSSSLVVPVGDNNSKGNPAQGSIRYNTEDTQFEGFNGAQWGGLGGVKDIDQDTKIEAETAPNADEDILYFFNAGSNTLRLTTSQLEFDQIDTITSSDSDLLNVNVSTVTFNNLDTTLDNTSTTETFLFSTKSNFDFGLSSGLNTDHLLRLQNSGDIVYNLGFGTGTPNNLTLLNDNLTAFELRDVKVSTNKLTLERGTLNSANATIYNIPTEASAKVCLTAHNTTTGDKELIEYYVVDDGTDVYFTDYNNVKSGAELVSVVYDIDPVNNVRLTVNLNTALATGDAVTVTLVKTITKR